MASRMVVIIIKIKQCYPVKIVPGRLRDVDGTETRLVVGRGNSFLETLCVKLCKIVLFSFCETLCVCVSLL